MSSLGSQWRVLRHYLSLSNLNAEFEKVVQKIRPSSPEQWDNLLKRFERAVAGPVSHGTEVTHTLNNHTVNATTINETTPHTTTKLSNESSEETAEVIEIEPTAASTAASATPNNATPATSGVVPAELKDLTFRGLLQGLILKKDTHLGKISEPTWKNNKPVVTKSSIHARTAYVIGAVVNASDAESVRRRAERLVDHLHQFPEARDYAIKEGAVRALLRVQNQLRCEDPLDREIDGVVNEALALVGHTGPPRGPGANILSLDGGGIRGLIAIEILRHLEQRTGRRVHELFDYVIGVSTGAIIAAVIGSGAGSLERASQLYRSLSRDMFGATSRLSGGARLVWTHSYYDTLAWEKMLQDNLQDCTLTHCNRYNTPKVALVSCVVNAGALSPFLFRSYSVGWRVRSLFPGSARARLWQAVRASAAAPTYFDEFRLDGLLHQDGGIMVNNPCGVGLHEAKLLFGARALRRGTVVSVGTGRPLSKQHDYSGVAHDTPATSWKDKFHKILDSATDTEGVHCVLNDLLPEGQYYRFNPPLMQECTMDEIDPKKLDDMIVDTQAYIRRNQHKFSEAAAMLTRKRSLAQRLADSVHKRALLAGATFAH